MTEFAKMQPAMLATAPPRGDGETGAQDPLHREPPPKDEPERDPEMAPLGGPNRRQPLRNTAPVQPARSSTPTMRKFAQNPLHRENPPPTLGDLHAKCRPSHRSSAKHMPPNPAGCGNSHRTPCTVRNSPTTLGDLHTKCSPSNRSSAEHRPPNPAGCGNSHRTPCTERTRRRRSAISARNAGRPTAHPPSTCPQPSRMRKFAQNPMHVWTTPWMQALN